MPTYEYACKACQERLEVVQAFSDEPLTECPSCGGQLRKVFSSVGIAFKGSGFYKNDSRKAGSSASSAKTDSSGSGSSSATGSGDASSSTSGDTAKAAPAKSESSTGSSSSSSAAAS